MIKVISITPSPKNDAWDVIRFENVLNEFEKASGKKARSTGQAFLADQHKFTVGLTFDDVTIVSTEYDTPQYVGHEPYDVNGKYYTNSIVEKRRAN
jgi:hypothetical protein